MSLTVPPQPMVYLEADPAVAEQLYKEWQNAQKRFCSCVDYAKRMSGYSKPVGLARNWPINSEVPTVGAVVVLNEGPVGHVAVVKQILDSTIVITEANYRPCQVDSRELPIIYPNILGYYTP